MSAIAAEHPDTIVNTPLGGPALTQERRLVTSIPGPRSQELIDRKAQAVAAGGGVIVDADGNSLIDLGSGIAVTTIGNAHPKVVAAVQEQVAQFTHTCFMIAPYESYVGVAEALNRITPGDHAKKSALFNSGAEAVENAVKIARVATGRVKLTTLTKEFFVPGFLERDEGEREPPYEKYPWDGISGVRPFRGFAASTTVGVY